MRASTPTWKVHAAAIQAVRQRPPSRATGAPELDEQRGPGERPEGPRLGDERPPDRRVRIPEDGLAQVVVGDEVAQHLAVEPRALRRCAAWPPRRGRTWRPPAPTPAAAASRSDLRPSPRTRRSRRIVVDPRGGGDRQHGEVQHQQVLGVEDLAPRAGQGGECQEPQRTHGPGHPLPATGRHRGAHHGCPDRQHDGHGARRGRVQERPRAHRVPASGRPVGEAEVRGQPDRGPHRRRRSRRRAGTAPGVPPAPVRTTTARAGCSPARPDHAPLPPAPRRRRPSARRRGARPRPAPPRRRRRGPAPPRRGPRSRPGPPARRRPPPPTPR